MTYDPSWSNLAKVVYLRTYSRKDKGHRENFSETVERVLAGNIRGFNVSEHEQQRLRYFLSERKAGPAGRGWWFSGAPTHELIGSAATANCWFVTLDKVEHFVHAQDLLMLGGGVGFSCEHQFVSKLPRVKKGVRIIHRPSNDADFIIPDSREGWNEFTRRMLEAYFDTGRSFSFSTVCVRPAGEPIKGFGGVAGGPGPLIDFAEDVNKILQAREGRRMRPIDASDLMCAIGEMVVSGNTRRCLPGDALVHTKEGLTPIKDIEVGAYAQTSKGYAKVSRKFVQGVQPLVKIITEDGSFRCTPNHRMAVLTGVEEYTWVEAKDLTPNDLLATSRVPLKGQVFGEGSVKLLPTRVIDVVPDGEAETFDIEVEEVHEFFCNGYLTHNSALLALGDAWDKEFLTAKRWDLGTLPRYRSRANYSVVCDDVEDLHPAFWRSYANGEAFGIVNRKNIQSYGRMGELKADTAIGVNPCAEATLENLESCNLQSLALPRLNGIEEFEEAARLMHRWGKRVAAGNWHIPEVQEVVRRNNRIGTSLTGCLNSPLFNKADLDRAYAAIQDENVKYSAELGIAPSIRTTTMNPSGTLGKFFDMQQCEGAHAPYSRYIIQRVRFAASDPLIPLLAAAGHHMEPERRLDGTLDLGTLVVDFYEAAPDGVVVSDDGSWDMNAQLENVKFVQRHWADQSVSVTVYYRRAHIEEVKTWLRDNLSEIKTISFLEHSEHGYVQAPKEAIRKDTYLSGIRKLKPLDVDHFGREEIDGVDGTLLSSMECAGGHCPIR